MPLCPGVRLGPYEIVAHIAGGGMGEVYRARDVRLTRHVALKILPPDAAGDRSRRRFEQEARSASTLTHPHIVTIYDVGEADRVAYIAMEFVAGRTLREIGREGPVPLDMLLNIAVQARAQCDLAAANAM